MNTGPKKEKFGLIGLNGILIINQNSRWMIEEYFVD